MKSSRNDVADSKRNVKSKGREFKTPYYGDANVTGADRGGGREDDSGFYLEYKSSSSKSSSETYEDGTPDEAAEANAPMSLEETHDVPGVPDMIAVTTVKNIRRRYNTTSTVHAAHTITSPH